MSSVTAQALEDEDSPQLRKARGAFFTPALLCDYVVDWAIRSANDQVLEPSCGDAEFLVAAAKRLSRLGGSVEAALHGVELHEDSAAQASARLQRDGNDVKITVSDFFDVTPTPVFDAVVGDPPYVRYQDFTGSSRSRSRAAALRAGVALTGLASSWAAFTVHAAQFLKPGGRMGLVVPAELLSVNYAAEVRRLMENFGEERLVMFTERVFPGVLEEVVLLLADGFAEGPVAHCELYQTRNAASFPQRSGVAGHQSDLRTSGPRHCCHQSRIKRLHSSPRTRDSRRFRAGGRRPLAWSPGTIGTSQCPRRTHTRRAWRLTNCYASHLLGRDT